MVLASSKQVCLNKSGLNCLIKLTETASECSNKRRSNGGQAERQASLDAIHAVGTDGATKARTGRNANELEEIGTRANRCSAVICMRLNESTRRGGHYRPHMVLCQI